MEDYEEKYKEALERARIFKSPYCQHTAEVIFPELKESEDEKIRKGLIKGLSAMRDIHKHQTFSDDAINIDDAIAWLENQDEQKSTDSYCQKNCKGFQETGKCFADGDCKAKRDAEQNPFWSEEDENVINHLLAICAGAKRYRQFAGCLQDDITKYQNWLKSLKPNHWKPSEEQMEALVRCLYEDIHQDKELYAKIESLYNDLKNL